MAEERAFIARVEAAEPAEFAEILRRASAEEGRLLRRFFGDARFRAMRGLALQASPRGACPPLGNVVVLPGFMGSELATCDTRGRGDRDLLWISAPRLLAGEFARLRLNPDGTAESDPDCRVEPVGVMKKYYGELILSLQRRWDVRAFAYDWRKDVDVAAHDLRAHIARWFGDEEPVHLVAHGLGGLVARAYIRHHPARWQQTENGEGARLVMLGAPNRGSFAIVPSLLGSEGLSKQIARVDLHHRRDDLAAIANSFVAIYQMLPTPDEDDPRDPVHQLYFAPTYRDAPVSQDHLDRARDIQRALRQPVSREECIFSIAGANRPTLDACPADPARLEDHKTYRATVDGDGWVTHERGRWTDADGRTWPAAENWYEVDDGHADLPRNKRVGDAVDELLETGGTDRLPHQAARRTRQNDPPLVRYNAARNATAAEAERLARRLQPRRFSRGTVFVSGGRTSLPSAEDAADQPLTVDEARLQDLLVLGRLDDPAGDEGDGPPPPGSVPAIEIRLRYGLIENLDGIADIERTGDGEAALPVDAIAVGHYLGVRPQAAELALDAAISNNLPGGRRDLGRDGYVLTQFTDRQTFVGELGRPFFLPDPRADAHGRLIAIAGMGIPGRFGAPELTVLARELVWALDRLGRRHLAAVLIGNGTGNLTPRQAVRSWLRGIELALRGRGDEQEIALRRVTFVNRTPATIMHVHDAIVDQKEHLAQFGRLVVRYDRYPPEAEAWLEAKIMDAPSRQSAGQADPREAAETEARAAFAAKAEWRERLAGELDERRQVRDGERRERTTSGEAEREPMPTRLTIDLDRDGYRFSAITDTAAIPERFVPVTPRIVDQINDELAQEAKPEHQIALGEFMERFLLHEDIRPHLATDAPLVLLLDTKTARIHWEMLAQPDPVEVARSSLGEARPLTREDDFARFRFLGTARGLTRQLRTTFAPPPEPPPPPRHRVRVLVVADPADDAPLIGAEEEGVEVVALFEEFNRRQDPAKVAAQEANLVEVVHLSGPTEASLTNVLVTLMRRPFDILHFAGHCFYDKLDPSASGYIFRDNPREVLSARDLDRVDRVPKFVFSNACESGVTPDRIDRRSIDLPPSFAEVFFKQGVANFICTAWPIDDLAARRFARTLYAGLLGLKLDHERRVVDAAPEEPLPIYRAMQEARIDIATTLGGAQTWGAYQHYGNPYFRLFAPSAVGAEERPAAAGAD